MIKYINKLVTAFALFIIAISVANCSSDELYLNVDVDNNKSVDTLRVISYNILEGMKEDKKNNYDNFVAWLKKHDPDILALQEVNGFTQKSLEALAERYGHPYVITNVKIGDNYPVALTSKHPIQSRRRITKHVSHGAIFARIKDVNVVVGHLWPQKYWYDKEDGRGDEYREQEVRIFLDSTIRKYPDEPKWIFAGDFNSRSEKDFKPGSTEYNFEVHRTIEAAGYQDFLHYFYGNKRDGLESYPVRYPGARIDFVYGTPAVLKNTVRTEFIDDDFTVLNKYSDHPPMLVDFIN